MSNVDQPHRDTNDGDDLEVEGGGGGGGGGGGQRVRE